MSHESTSDVNYPEMVVAEIGDNTKIRAFHSNFDPSEPDDSLFQVSMIIITFNFY